MENVCRRKIENVHNSSCKQALSKLCKLSRNHVCMHFIQYVVSEIFGITYSGLVDTKKLWRHRSTNTNYP